MTNKKIDSELVVCIAIIAEGWVTPQWLREQLKPMLPDVDIRCFPDVGAAEDIDVLICDDTPTGLLSKFPKLKFIQKLGAGVDSMFKDPDLGAAVRVSRLKSSYQSRELAEYCLLYVLQLRRHSVRYAENQRQGLWREYEIPLASEVTVALLGLGNNGAKIAKTFAGLDFNVVGWSQTEKIIAGVDSYTGEQGLEKVLNQSDFVICSLPSTQKTRGLINGKTLKQFKPGSTLINVGRGDLIVESDMLEALDKKHLSHAVLDVFMKEPLESGHPFWTHAEVTITPHVAGWNVLNDVSLADVAENCRRLKNGEALLHEVDRKSGY